MLERERSYIIAPEYFANSGIKYDPKSKAIKITDHYLDRETRVRHSIKIEGDEPACGASHLYQLCHKEGSKSEGCRSETETEISKTAYDILKRRSVLEIEKIRRKVDIASLYKVTVDEILSPMALMILEIEVDSHRSNSVEVPENICETLLRKKLKVCPLSAFELFKRRIGVCGGPSAGKSETAKFLSHDINTRLKGNAWHVAEFATTFIQKYERNPDFTDQFFIWYGQRQREINASKSDIVVSDCPTFLSYIYALNQNRIDSKSAMVLSKIYKRVLFDLQNYTDIIFLNKLTYKDNKIRYQNPEEADRISGRIKMFLDDHKISYIETDCFRSHALTEELFHINSEKRHAEQSGEEDSGSGE